MANIFLNSAAVGLADGTTWADAYTTVAAAIAGLSTGDTLAWANTSSEVIDIQHLDFPDDSIIICSTVSGVSTITSAIASATQIESTSVFTDTRIKGNNCHIYGVKIRSGQGIAPQGSLTTNNCYLEIAGAVNRASRLRCITGERMWTSNYDTIECLNTTLQAYMVEQSVCSINMFNPTFIYSGVSQPATYNLFESGSRGVIICNGGDASGVAFDNVLSPSTSSAVIATIKKLHINASTAMVDSSATINGNIVSIDATDSANNVNRQFYSGKQGDLLSDTGIVLDATSPSSATVSNKVVTTASAVEFFSPARFSIIQGWADFSTAKTIDIEFAQDGTTTALTDAEIWVEVQYPDDTTSVYHVDTDRASDNQTTANQTTSAASWTGLSGTNVKQKCSVTTTQTGKAGPYQVFICVAKPSTTVYVNPKADIS